MPSTSKTSLTIPALKDALRRSGLLGRALLNNSNYELGPLCGRTDTETLERARSALNHYFNLIKNANMTEWENGRDGFVCTNVAIQAYIMLFGSLIKYWEVNTASDGREMEVEDMMIGVEEYLQPIIDFLESSNPTEIKSAFHVPFGSGGPPEYRFRLCKLIKEKYSDFQPEGMEEWEEEQSEERIQEADRKLKEIVSEMCAYIFDVFRARYGEKWYWDKGVTDNGIKAEAYKRSLDYDVEDRLPLETYLDVVDMKKVVEKGQNWSLFKTAFNIPEPGEKGIAKNLKWMVRVNELRRIPAHPARERHYRLEDFQYIDFVYEELMKRLQDARENPVLEPSLASETEDD